MLKIVAEFEVTVNEKIGRFIVDQDTPVPVAKEMCFQFLKWIGDIEEANKKAKAESDKEAAEQAKCDESKCEPIDQAG